MRTNELCLPLLEEPLELQIILSQRERQILKNALTVLCSIRNLMEKAYGEDDAYEVHQCEPWITAQAWLSEAVDNMHGDVIKLPPGT
jgi:hypothetical protein